MKSLLGLFILHLPISTSAFIMEPHELSKDVPTVTAQKRLKAMKAILNGDLETVREMVELGADPHFSTTGQRTIFHIFAEDTDFNHISKLKYPDTFSKETLIVLQYLLDQGANVNNFSGPNGNTPLDIAFSGVDSDYPHCRAGYLEFLLKNGADPDKGHRSSTTYRVWSPFQNVTTFCGRKALEIYFSYKPNFKRGRCVIEQMDTKEDQENFMNILEKITTRQVQCFIIIKKVRGYQHLI
jgi:ankyrin repeat protein